MKSLFKLSIAAMFAALTAVFSQISFPLPFTPIPVNLATLSVLLSGLLLGFRYGIISQTVYMLVGMAGFPVFAKMQGGVGVLLGPTGGFIFGYILCVAVVGLLVKKNAIVASALGMIFCYISGSLWFSFVTNRTIFEALLMCVVPFLLGDALKILTALILHNRLSNILTSLLRGA